MKRKKRIYFDTSVIGYLDDEPSNEKEYASILWDKCLQGEYDVIISDVVFREIKKNLNIHRVEQQLAIISLMNYEFAETNDDIYEISELIKNMGIIPDDKQKEDRFHIASAIYYEADYLVSYNYKHLSNVRIANGIKSLTIKEGFKTIEIIPPSMLI
jgi:predicted nucleic acid-binding protein